MPQITDSFLRAKGFRMRVLICFFACFLMLASPVSESTVILKTKGKRAFIHLEGHKTKKGAWFEVMDLYGQSKGLVQITKVGRSRAIGLVRLGRIKKHWALEPQSASWARKLKRRVQLKKKRAYLRRLARAKKFRKRNLRRRGLASANVQDEGYLINSASNDDYGDDSGDYPSEKTVPAQAPSPKESHRRGDESDYVSYSYQEEQSQGLSLRGMDMAFGLMGAGGLNSIILKPIETNLSGLGWEGLGFLEMNFRNGFGMTGFVGYKNLQMANHDSSKCGSSDPCSLVIQYIKVGMDLKYIFLKNTGFDIWGGLNGSLLWTMKESVSNKAGLNEDSFGIHGTLGPVLGVTFKTGQLIFPLSLRASIFNPPTETTFSWAVFFRAGMGLSI